MTERIVTFMTAINEAMAQAMRKDDNVILIGTDVAGGAEVDHLVQDDGRYDDAFGGVFGLSKGLVTEFGRERVIDTPIAEHGYFGAAVGAAATGLRPIAELMFNDFIGFALDPILNQGAKMRYMFGGKAKMPLTVRTVHGAGAGAAAQHSQTLYGMFGAIPGVKVVVPSNPYDAKGLMLAAVEEDNLVVFSEDKLLYGMKGHVPEDYYTVEIGKANVIREGKDMTIVAIGKMVQVAEETAQILAKDDISVEVIDLRTVAPWDEETVMDSVKKTGRLIVIDESNPHNNTATDIASVVADKAFDYLDGPIKTVCAPNTPVPFATNLEQAYIPDAAKVLRVADEIIADLKQ
ncbi:acetoin dehydrogenase E1 component beta subunit [Niallia circulans]|jgi:acetoin:2,6-dichlorophenolindophenol oxidoreductase subunit beta|uniref:Alpha-ketoacid dehydrogenase subunit beta n=1 Tax=Shouchella clausii TaxID=79880 RepID=A0A268RZJ6_SHOCL|nr:alpha-ketoacid dehydrogenase subunit beta [Shouchella clausii]SPT80602.1 acetoin dehydrogenase E1 component beta subunit [Niallia circulans]AST96950.1 alpha-ketoacid dehydrogenase subunit beta [Shouchella clausii]MBU8597639.1 alpha-ketoacid dehydrogenase subunit beta [Shouchella clausii]MCM3547556.1 alpha-ketoacid dehydrogenase subunit beta [Shouchella clausii]MCR1286445.1 alpha-ketoacid dehydrogenase subunit beta [Shouchella clausii]